MENTEQNKSIVQQIAEHFISVIVPSPEFTTNSVISSRDLLFPPMKNKVDSLLFHYSLIEKENKSDFEVYESFRSANRQLEEYLQGNSRKKSNGMHYFGIAVDIVNYSGGKWAWKGDYETLTGQATGLGLTHLQFEACHFQFIPVWQQNDLIANVNNEVLHFQQMNGLKIDGVIGKNTIAKAVEVFAK